MRTVLPLELAGKTRLNFDVYDEKGVLVIKKGELIEPGILLKMETNNLVLYKMDDNFTLEDFDNEPPISTNAKAKSFFSEKSRESLLGNTKKIMQAVFDGDGVNAKKCDEVKDIVITEVAANLDKIKGMSELRIYDKYTFSHTINVCSLSTALGMILGLEEEYLNELSLGALLHDIGKLLVPKEILLKPGKLDENEFEIMKKHTTMGYDYLKQNTDVPEQVANVALSHQERYGGGGYPNKQKANEIHYYAQIAAIVDVYDALLSDRVYKKGMENPEVLRILLAEGSKSFNPVMLYKFVYMANYREGKKIVES